MDEKEELKRELEQELKWLQYRQSMLTIIEKKLLQMKELAGRARLGNLTEREIKELNAKINYLASQVKALDEESRKSENKKILE